MCSKFVINNFAPEHQYYYYIGKYLLFSPKNIIKYYYHIHHIKHIPTYLFIFLG